ncbi:ABC transporter permease [Pseudonocardia acaciae]|uniref:ABC transporter permease n=1 Tax=Pseudonocardia acaciae TaxID=551276 RepID=UPI00048FE8F2|nr:ABC transporter permease [Pseudonocardia acaciae]
MTTVTTETAEPDALPANPRRGKRTSGRALRAWTLLVLAWLFLPVAGMIVFGFNDTQGKFNNTWQGFTLRWYRDLFAIPDLTVALVNSLTIATLTAVIAGALGSLIGYALGRYRFRGAGLTDLVMFAAISAPEVVMGASLLSMYLNLGIPRGYLTILIAHVMFSVSFVAITVRARTVTLDPSLEEAARDLGATPAATFRLVTVPMLLPGILAGAVLAFALSIDDFIITNFTAGSTQTFPLWIWGATRLGIPPQVNVMGTLIFAIGVIIAAASTLATRRNAR